MCALAGYLYCSLGDVVDPQRRILENDRLDRPLNVVAAHSISHSVHFYEQQARFLDELSEFVAATLRARDSLILVLTQTHREGLDERLAKSNSGIDFELAIREDRYIVLDSEEALAEFMVEGWPDKSLLFSGAESLLRRAKSSAQRGSGSVVVCGEVAPLLAAQGKHEAAIYVEKLWAELVERHGFTLRCVYSVSCFEGDVDQEIFNRLCALHDHVVPAESYTSLKSDEDRMRVISLLQQRASAIQAVMEGREREIAKQRETELRLRDAEQFAERVLESSLDCLKLLDLEGHLEYMSPVGRKVLEIESVDQILGKRWIDFWKEEDRPRVSAAVAAARNGQVGTFRGDLPTRSGIPKSWDVRVTPVFGIDGEVEQLIAISRDVTELQKSQQVAAQAEKLAAAGRLAATIAHEINNPLEAVTNLIFLAKSTQGVPEEVCRQLEIADRELARVAQLAQQTLGFYRDNSSSKWVSVSELIADVLLIYERKLTHKRLQTAVSIDPRLKVYGKQGELKQAMSNLVANAIEASKIGGRLLLNARSAKNWMNGMVPGVRFTVADNGAGMTPDVRRQVFVPFFTTKPGIGTGIGLWVTKSIIEQQGGFMHFRSRQGQNAGTVMSFFVPDAPLST